MMDRHQQVIAAAVLLIVGGALGFAAGRAAERGIVPSWKTPELFSPASRPSPQLAGTVLSGGNAIAVSDQAPGATVAVSFVTLAGSGWAVIHEERDGAPGAILGARRFDTGSGQSGTVELLRPTEEGRVYLAMLHGDDGDRQFDHTQDLPIRDPQGNAILMRFVAAASPPER